MYDKINLTELERMVRFAEETPELNIMEDFKMPSGHHFSMISYFRVAPSCGTAGCLVGTYLMKAGSAEDLDTLRRIAVPNPRLSVKDQIGDQVELMRRTVLLLGVGRSVHHFLFVSHTGACVPAVRLSKDGAIARLTKYIAHVRDMRRRWENHAWLMSLPKRERRRHLLAPRGEAVPA